MVVIEAKLKKWGNSFGVVIPIEVISSEHMKENENIRLILQVMDLEYYLKKFIHHNFLLKFLY